MTDGKRRIVIGIARFLRPARRVIINANAFARLIAQYSRFRHFERRRGRWRECTNLLME